MLIEWNWNQPILKVDWLFLLRLFLSSSRATIFGYRRCISSFVLLNVFWYDA